MFLLLTTNKAAMTSCVKQQFKTRYPFFSILTRLSHGQWQIKHFFRGKKQTNETWTCTTCIVCLPREQVIPLILITWSFNFCNTNIM